MVTKATRDVLDLSIRPVLDADINGGTIDGTTIGATTPSTGEFTTLEATSTMSLANGAVGTPSLTFSTDPNTGIYRVGEGQLGIAADGVAMLRVQNNNSGANASVVLSSTDALQMVSGTTAQRPSVPVNGMMRYNSTLGEFEGYENGAWATLSTTELYTVLQPLLNPVSVQTDFYVDSVTGNDSTGNGTTGSPFKTINRAFQVGNDTSNIFLSAITIHAQGSFTGTEYKSSNSGNIKNVTLREWTSPITMLYGDTDFIQGLSVSDDRKITIVDDVIFQCTGGGGLITNAIRVNNGGQVVVTGNLSFTGSTSTGAIFATLADSTINLDRAAITINMPQIDAILSTLGGSIIMVSSTINTAASVTVVSASLKNLAGGLIHFTAYPSDISSEFFNQGNVTGKKWDNTGASNITATQPGGITIPGTSVGTSTVSGTVEPDVT